MFRAIDDHVIVKPDREFWKTKRQWKDDNGIQIIHPAETGVVVSVGEGEWLASSTPGQHRKTMSMQPGDRIVFDADDSYSLFSYDGTVYLRLSSYEIMGIID